MAGLQTISPTQRAALDRGAERDCPTCPKHDTPPAALKPETYVLRLCEFKDHGAARSVLHGDRPLAPADYTAVDSSKYVYIVRRQGGRTKVEPLKGVSTYTFTVAPGDGPVEIYACISEFALPPVRVAQYKENSAELLAAVRRRFVRFAPNERRSVRPTGGTTYDLVMPNYRRLGWEVHAREQQARDKLAAYAADGNRARRRFLATLTLETAAQLDKMAGSAHGYVHRDVAPGGVFASETTNVDRLGPWAHLQRVPRPSGDGQTARPEALRGKPYTRCEAELAQYDRELQTLQRAVEHAADAKYAWMSMDGYREMRWDSLTDPAQQRLTVQAEAVMLTPASQSKAGQGYLKDYATRAGKWYLRFLKEPLEHETHATKTDPVAAESYWALLASVGVALTQGDVTEADQSGNERDLAKSMFGGADFLAKDQLDHPTKHADVAARGARTSRAEVAGATDRVHAAEGAAAQAEREANRIEMVADYLVYPSIARHTGLPKGAIPTFARDPATGRYQSVLRVEAHVPKRSGELHPALDARVGQTTGEAEQAQARLATAVEGERRAGAHYIDALAMEKKFARGAAVTSGMVAAIGLINLAFAVRSYNSGDKQSRIKAWGAIADLLYSAEYGLVRWQKGEVRAAATVAEAGAAEGGAAKLLLAGCRLVGLVGAILSILSSVIDFKKAQARGNIGLEVGAALSIGGNAMLGLAIVGEIGKDSAIVATMGLMGAAEALASLTGVGILLVFLGAVAVLYFTNPPVVDWLRGCPWGVHPSAADDGEQLRDLLQLLCAPRMVARAYSAGEPGAPAGALGGVCFTISPPLFFNGSTRVTLDLDVYAFRSGGFDASTAVGSVARQEPSAFRLGGTAGSIVLGPIPDDDGARAERSTIRVDVGGAIGVGATRVGALMRKVGDEVLFDVYVPVRDAVPGGRRSYGEPQVGYAGARGRARVELWAQTREAWRRALSLDEFALALTPVRERA